MIVAVAALLLAASLSVGLRATSGWLDHWHPLDRLVLATVLGGVIIAASLLVCERYQVVQAGYGLAFSLAPVGLFDVTKWWFRSRGTRTSWLIRAEATAGLLALRWGVVFAAIAVLAWVVMSAASDLDSAVECTGLWRTSFSESRSSS